MFLQTPDNMAIPVKSAAFRTMSQNTGLVRKLGSLVQTYSDAVQQSRKTGQTIRITIDVPPEGVANIHTAEALTALPQAVDDQSPEIDVELALSDARQRGRVRVAAILTGEDMLSADEFATLLGTTRATINSKRQNRQLLGLEGTKRGFRFPEWQIDQDGKPFGALPRLFETLGDSPWAVYRFLVQHHPELNGATGREALQAGRSGEALAAAENAARAFA